jgi:N-acyl-D-amino-acid deacylase
MVRLLILSVLAAGTGMAQSPTGLPASGFEDVDAAVQQAMSTYHVPGVSLAIVKDGRLVLARGYGFAESESSQPMQPGTLVRWNSISKTITATAILKLVEQGKLNLDTPAFNYLSRIQPYNGTWGDSRIRSITLRQLLGHTGGWDSARSGEPITSPLRDQIAAAVGGPFLPTAESTLRYMIARPLDFVPGARYAYSTFGFMILGMVVAEVSGQSYEQFMRANVFEPVGSMDMHVAGN